VASPVPSAPVSSLATAHRLFGARPGPGRIVDIAVAALALTGSVAQLSHGGLAGTHAGPGELDWTGGVLAACSTLPLIAWRHAPRGVFLVTGAAAVLLGTLGYPIPLALGPALALFLLAVSRDEEDRWSRADSAAVAALFLAYLGGSAIGDGRFPGTELLHTGLAWAVAWFAGDRTRLRHEHIAELAERATRNEREAERERLLAIAEERARIARDLHDSAGHAINVIAVRAGAARMRKDPERSQAALEAIEEVARRTGAEIDQIVGTLRERGSVGFEVQEPPGLASLDTLVDRHAAAGLEVSVSSKGVVRRLDSVVDQAAYRILQESLTNAARHGRGAARVELAFGEAALELTVSNPISGDGVSSANGGHGLIGMRERATLLGGSLDVERANRSFRVRARLPYRGDHA
jgi:signal transduction histidine kinase